MFFIKELRRCLLFKYSPEPRFRNVAETFDFIGERWDVFVQDELFAIDAVIIEFLALHADFCALDFLWVGDERGCDVGDAGHVRENHFITRVIDFKRCPLCLAILQLTSGPLCLTCLYVECLHQILARPHLIVI